MAAGDCGELNANVTVWEGRVNYFDKLMSQRGGSKRPGLSQRVDDDVSREAGHLC